MKDDYPNIITDDGVYPPSEDTFLLVDTVTVEPHDRVLEVGCGSGYTTVVVSRVVDNLVALDISLEAAKNTRDNMERNGLGHRGCVFQADLLQALQPDAMFSVIMFNPPYLPRDGDATALDHALVGGEKGVETTLAFVEIASRHLSNGGSIFVIASSLADVDLVRERMSDLGLDVTVAGEREFFFETLYVLRGTRK
jgi:release factor glutamine methyltransferase